MKTAAIALALLMASVWPGAAQSWDTSGNQMLNGKYYFREVIYVTDLYYYGNGMLSELATAYGTITFDGNGSYTLSGSYVDTALGTVAPQTYTASGTYSLAASGMGFATNPLSGGDWVYGLASNGVFIGSTTESGYNDLFIAIPAGDTPATAATFDGNYIVGHWDTQYYDPTVGYACTFTLPANGNGGVTGSVKISGYTGTTGSALLTQTSSGITYSFSDGVGTLSFPTGQTLTSGSKRFYISGDGNYILGGDTSGFDIFFGVRTTGTASGVPTGLYYTSGLDLDVSPVSSGYVLLDSYFGSMNLFNEKNIETQRIASPFANGAYDYSFTRSFTASSDGTFTNSGETIQYAMNSDGTAGIGLGIGPYLGLTVALRAPNLTGSDVWINPMGVVNAASSAPFTAGWSRGQMITIYGSGLADNTELATSVPFPTTLGDVQVLVNGTPAPVNAVSPGQVSALIPWGTDTSIASIQVVNHEVTSNTVTNFMNLASPGVFTYPAGGIGYAAALHATDGSLVTADSPAQVGEYVALFLSGLGDVSPAVGDGEAGPLDPLSYATNPVNVYVDGTLATTNFVGLAPQLAGLYQINVLVPEGIHSGDVILSISGYDSVSSEATLLVAPGPSTQSAGSATTLAAKPFARSVVVQARATERGGGSSKTEKPFVPRNVR